MFIKLIFLSLLIYIGAKSYKFFKKLQFLTNPKKNIKEDKKDYSKLKIQDFNDFHEECIDFARLRIN